MDWLKNAKSLSTDFEPESGAAGHYVVVLTADERARLLDIAPPDLQMALGNVGGYVATDPEIDAYFGRVAV